jgi:hypothetical protein
MEFSFSEATTVDDITKVPEQYRPLYTAKDGKHTVDTSDPKIRGAVEGLIFLDKALGAARKEARDHKAKIVDISPLREYGESPVEIQAAVKTKIDELTNQLAQGKNGKLDLEAVRTEMNKAHAIVVGAKDKRIDALTGQLHKVLIENAATNAITELKGDAQLLMPFVLARAKATEEDDGTITVNIVDDKNAIRFSPATGKPMMIGEFVKEMKNDSRYGKLFESATPRGGGTPPGGPARIPAKGVGDGEKSPNQKISSGLAARGIK